MFNAHIVAWENHLARIFCKEAGDYIASTVYYDEEADEIIFDEFDMPF